VVITVTNSSKPAAFLCFKHRTAGFRTEIWVWSLTLREEHRLRVFENRVLRRIFRPKRGEVTGDWRKLHNEELE
jgi:hypothetical protein